MAQTHQEVVKVWIAPGCIVCDSCESDCPEVFDVQEETCVIRPQALKADFTRPLTPSIIAAAEGCPVDVIKFDTVEVEGPEPWAHAAEAALAAGPSPATTAPAKKAGPVIPEGPPDPKWAGLLSTSYTSHGPEAGGAGVATRPSARPAAKVTAEVLAQALPGDAPPDAKAAAVLGTAYGRAKPTVSQRIRERSGVTRREAAGVFAGASVLLWIAWSSMAAVAATWGGAFQSFLVPKLTKEPPSTFKAGKLSDYPSDGVYEQYKGAQQVWIIRRKGKLFALSTICTHLGCIPNWLPADSKFKCPCHGSGFYMDGVNFEGPAPRPLERFAIKLEGDTVIIDKSRKFRSELNQWGLPNSELLV